MHESKGSAVKTPANHRPRPSRRGFLISAAAFGASALLPFEKALAVKRADAYIFVLLCDALRADRLGCYGYQRQIKGVRQSITPTMDRMASQGVLYEHCVAQASWTQTSMASLLTSTWPVIKGNEHTFDYVPEGAQPLKSATPGMYRFGLHTNPYMKEPIFSDQFDEFKYLPHSAGTNVPEEYAPALEMNREFDWIAGPMVRDGKALFGYIHYMDPHEPYTYRHEFRGAFAPPGWKYMHPILINKRLLPYRDDTGRVTADAPDEVTRRIEGMADAYDEDVAYLDKSLKRVFDLLKDYRIADRTTVILAADHGQSFGEHGWWGHKVTLYEPELHVPLIIAGPDIPKGVRVKSQVRNVDILPTIAAILGGDPKGFAGSPLLPADRVEGQGNRFAYSCCDYTIYGDVNRLLTCLVTPKRQKYIRVLTTDHKLLREELYDLAADPDEKKDLAPASQDLIADLSKRLTAFESSVFWRTTSGGAPKIDKATEEALKALGYVNH